MTIGVSILRDIAAFRIVYIREAHAADSDWPMAYAKEKGINEHKNYGERCAIAERLLEDENVKMPTIIDKMDNRVDEAYNGHPTRAFAVRKDGRLGVAGKQGPWGLTPALKEAKEWLEQYRKTGKEPELPGEQGTEGDRS